LLIDNASALPEFRNARSSCAARSRNARAVPAPQNIVATWCTSASGQRQRVSSSSAMVQGCVAGSPSGSLDGSAAAFVGCAALCIA